MKKKILFIMHMPPPVHGAAMVGKNIHDSKCINELYDCNYINPSLSSNVASVGKVSFKKLLIVVKLIMQICTTIKKTNPDLCYYTPTSDGWGIFKDALVIKLMKAFGAKRIILHMHNKGVLSFSKKRLARIAYKMMFKDNKIILLAKELRSDLASFVDDSQLFYLGNGMPATITDEEYDKIEASRITIDRQIRILYLSNMMSEKGIWVLLEAARILKERQINFHLDYVGNWGDTTFEQFTNKVAEFGLQNNVTVNGPKYGMDKVEFFKKSNVFCFPTYYHGECYPLVLIEAMEYGLPCISTPEGGIPSIIKDNENGFLCPQKDAIAIANKLIYLSQNIDVAKIIANSSRDTFQSKCSLSLFEVGLIRILGQCID